MRPVIRLLRDISVGLEHDRREALRHLKPGQVVDRRRSLEARQYRLERKRYRVEIAMLFLVVVGTAGAFLNLYFLRKSVDDSHTAALAAKANADAAKVAADAALAQASAARDAVAQAGEANSLNRQSMTQTLDSSRLERRAWIGTTGVQALTLQSGKPIAYSVPLRNTGETPGRDVTFRLQQRTLAGSAPFVATYDTPRNVTSAIVLLPGVTSIGVQRVGPAPLTQADIDMWKGATQRLYVFGEIRYRDVFNRSHQTTFCQFFDRDGAFKWCDTYNKAE
jgi:hypothetical protein